MCVDTQSNRRPELEEAEFRRHRQGAKCTSQTVEREGDGTAVCWWPRRNKQSHHRWILWTQITVINGWNRNNGILFFLLYLIR